VLNAWGKAMATGSLRGENLNSIITNSSRLAQALADSMGINVTQLREYGAQGLITRDVMLGVTDQLEQLRSEAAAMPATLSDGMGLLQDALFQFVGRMDQAVGTSAGFAEMLIGVADALVAATGPAVRLATIVSSVLGPAFDVLLTSLPVAASALAGFFAPAVLSGLGAVSTAIGTTMVSAVRALGAAMAANPLGLFIAAIAAAVTAAFMFRDQIRDVIGVDIVEAVKGWANNFIRLFDLAFRNIVAVWNNLPDDLGAIVILVVNAWIAGMEFMVNKAIQGFNKIIEAANGVARFFGADWLAENLGWGTGQVKGLPEFKLLRMPGEAAENALDKIGAAWTKNLEDTGQIDYLGELGAALGLVGDAADDASGSIAGLGGALDGNGTGGGAAGSAVNLGEAVDMTGEKMSSLGDIGRSVTDTLRNGFKDLFKSIVTGSGDAMDAVSNLLGKLGDLFLDQAFNTLFSGLSGSFGSAFGFSFPGLATGGRTLTAGLVEVGERGRELLALPAGAQVIRHGDVDQFTDNSGERMAIEINIDARGTTRDTGPSIAEQVRRALPDAIQAYNRSPYRRV